MPDTRHPLSGTDDAPGSANAPRPRRVLIVDDSPETRYTYQRFLSGGAVDYRFEEAETVAEGVARLAAASFDCVLLDFRLPDADGLALLRHLNAQAAPFAVPVIVTTSQGSESIAVEAMKLGARDYLVKGAIDAANLAAAIDRALSAAEADKEKAQRTRRLQQLSVTDELTTLYNRRYLVERLQSELARTARHGTPTCVLMIDLDHFKSVNDTRGHLVGDKVLIRFSAMLRTVARTTDVVARFGGEEFCMVLSETGLDGAEALARRVCEAARAIDHVDDAGERFTVTCSIGVAAAAPQDLTCESVLQKSDVALYQAKRGSRDGYRVYADADDARRCEAGG